MSNVNHITTSEQGRAMFRHILCAVDGSAQSNRAVELAADLAARDGAKLTLIHVGHSTSPPEGLEAYLSMEFRNAPPAVAYDDAIGQRIVEDATAQARRGRSITPQGVVDRGDPAEAILAAAKRDQVDCIVMGRRGHGRLAGLLLGSVSSKIAQLATCTTILVH